MRRNIGIVLRTVVIALVGAVVLAGCGRKSALDPPPAAQAAPPPPAQPGLVPGLATSAPPPAPTAPPPRERKFILDPLLD